MLISNAEDMVMKPNVGGADRIIRIVLGIAIIVTGVVIHSWWGLIGILPLATGLVRFCGLYPVLGINTCNTVNSTAKK